MNGLCSRAAGRLPRAGGGVAPDGRGERMKEWIADWRRNATAGKITDRLRRHRAISLPQDMTSIDRKML